MLWIPHWQYGVEILYLTDHMYQYFYLYVANRNIIVYNILLIYNDYYLYIDDPSIQVDNHTGILFHLLVYIFHH